MTVRFIALFFRRIRESLKVSAERQIFCDVPPGGSMGS
jgi:hypothetical protein